MKRTLALGLLYAALAFSQTATYPGAIVTDSQMMIAKDNCQSTLFTALANTSTSMVVSNGSCFIANSLATIGGAGGEQIEICGVSGNTLSIGHSSCPNINGRGFAGTTATSYPPGVTVALNVNSWFRNVDRVEIEAIETALGVNLSNVTGGWGGTSSPYNAVADGSPITWDFAGAKLVNGIVTLNHLTGTRALNVSNLANGGFYTLLVFQDSTGGASLTAGTGCTWLTPGGVASGIFPIDTFANAKDVLSFTYTGTYCLAVVQGFSAL